MTRIPLVSVDAMFCTREMMAGQVKRVCHRGPLVGYYIVCPACRWKATYLDEECGFIEEPAVASSPYPKRLLGMTKPPKCTRCKLTLQVRERYLEAA